MKMILFKRKRVTVLVCLLVAAAMFLAVNHPVAAEAAATTRQLPIYCVQRDQKMISISFDAAWGNEDTQMLIDILGKYNVKATFFVVGAWVDKYPESVKALADAGHEVMNHSNTHAHMSQLSRDEIIADVNACNDKVEAVTGVRPTLIRPPYGEYDDNVISAIRSIGMEPIQWDVDVSQTDSSSWSISHFRAENALYMGIGETAVRVTTRIPATEFGPIAGILTCKWIYLHTCFIFFQTRPKKSQELFHVC